MSDFNYEIETTNHYFFENFTVDGQSVQDGTPTPDSPVEIKVCRGRNIAIPFDSARVISGITITPQNDGSVLLTGTSTTNNAISVTSQNTTVSAGITYTASIGNYAGTGISDYGLAGFSTNKTITPSSDFKWCGINVYIPNGVTVSNVRIYPQLELGTTPTPYAPYGCIGLQIGETITPIDLQGNVLASLSDGTKDVLTVDSAGAVTLEKRVGVHVFDGTGATWSLSGGNKRIYTAAVRNEIKKASANTQVVQTLCNSFTPKTALQTYSGTVGVSVDTSGDVGFADGSTMATDTWNAWLSSNNVTLYYPLATPQTIDLGYIDVSNLKDISEEIPISIISTLDPETRYSYINHPSYDVLNPYEDYNAPEYAYPPNHFGQDWETFDANDWNKTSMLDYTGQPESHAVYTVELCELMQSGAFDWKRPELDWSEAAYDKEQFERFCKYFEARFMFREISMLPPLQWFNAFKRMMVYELMPKYKPLYTQIESGINPLGENEYYKERHVSSAYPETLLSGNSDYISSGEDKEWERVKINNAAEALESYRNGFRIVDAALGDELEVLFISMYTSFANVL